MTDVTTAELARLTARNLQEIHPDLLRALVRAFAQELMGAEADALCGAQHRQGDRERADYRSGYRELSLPTRAGPVSLAVPELHQGSYAPDWLLTHGDRTEQVLVDAVAAACLLGVSAQRARQLTQALGLASLWPAQVSELARALDEAAGQFRSRPLDAGPYRFVQAGLFTVRDSEGGRAAVVDARVATGASAEGHREILGFEIVSAGDRAGWLGFFRGLVTRGMTGVLLVTSDPYPGLVGALAAAMPGASWQRRQPVNGTPATRPGWHRDPAATGPMLNWPA